MELRRIARNFKGIIDSTLREGLQFSRADFSLAQQVEIFAFLESIGVDFIEMGNPVRAEVREAICHLLRRRSNPATGVLAHIRNNEQDLARALETGVDGVNILCTVDGERLAGLRLEPAAYVRLLEKNVAAARAAGLQVRVSVEDFFNQPEDLATQVYSTAESLGADRLGLADTLGRAMSWDVRRRVRELRRSIGTELEVHFHNDFGHAVSNALAALEAGANWVSVSLAGIGERTGITPLSTLLVNLHIVDPGLAARYNLEVLTRAESYVSRACGMDVPPHLLTSPQNGFAHKAGIHLQAVIHFGPHKYEPVQPGLIGNKRQMILHTPVSGKTTDQEAAEFNRRHG